MSVEGMEDGSEADHEFHGADTDDLPEGYWDDPTDLTLEALEERIENTFVPDEHFYDSLLWDSGDNDGVEN